MERRAALPVQKRIAPKKARESKKKTDITRETETVTGRRTETESVRDTDPRRETETGTGTETERGIGEGTGTGLVAETEGDDNPHPLEELFLRIYYMTVLFELCMNVGLLRRPVPSKGDLYWAAAVRLHLGCKNPILSSDQVETHEALP